jgi:hypothetical protein
MKEYLQTALFVIAAAVLLAGCNPDVLPAEGSTVTADPILVTESLACWLRRSRRRWRRTPPSRISFSTGLASDSTGRRMCFTTL